jgi:hypothetical protein
VRERERESESERKREREKDREGNPLVLKSWTGGSSFVGYWSLS